MHGPDYTNLVAFDTETTSPNPLEARLVTVAAIHMHVVQNPDGTSSVHEVSKFDIIVNPGVEIPQGAIDVHGVTNERAQAEGMPHEQGVALTNQFLQAAWSNGAVVVAYNAAYDLSIIANHTPGFRVGGFVYDPLVVQRAMNPNKWGGNKLGVVAESMGISLVNAHDAYDDARAAGMLVRPQLDKAREVMPEVYSALTDPARAMAFQSQANDTFMGNLGAYMRSKGRPFDDDNQWPVKHPAYH